MTITTDGIDIDTIVRWTKEREVQTKRGARFLSTAKLKLEDPFWTHWANSKAALQAAGISVSKDQFTNDWVACRWREIPQEEQERRAKSVEASRATDADIVIPAPEGCVYRPFQKAGIAMALTRDNNLIGDEPGLGKTIQALGVINSVKEIHRVLIITKATLKRNWQRECEKWLVRPMSVGIADASCFPSTDIVIINFDICHKFTRKAEFYWDLVVIDEAHYCKNNRSRRAKAILGYKPTRNEAAAGMSPSSGIPAKRKLMLTGTPFENKPAELYPLIRYLMGDRCMSKSAYEKKFCGGGMTGFGWQANGASNLEGLNRWLREEILIRRLKRDVLKELPPKTRVVVELESADTKAVVTNDQAVARKYETELSQAQATFELIKCIESDEEYDARRKELNKQFYIPFNEISKVRHETALAKVPLAVQAIQDDIDEIESNKILVFAHHGDVLAGLAKHFPKSVTIDGTMTLVDRDAKVQRFQNDKECGPFFGSIRATGEGLTLTAASLVVFVEEDWVPGKISQCEDRAHRIGQTDNVLVKHLVLKGTMDAKMVTTNVRKQEVLDVALDDEKSESITEPVLVLRHEPLATRKQIRIESSIVIAAQAAECHAAVKDFVAELGNDEEIGTVDKQIANALADMKSLTPKQAVLARKVCIRYKARFSRDISACGGWQGNQQSKEI